MTTASEKPDSPQVAAARIETARARSKLMGTAHELQERLSPKTLTRDAWEGAKTKGADLVEDAVDAVKARPLTTTGIVAAITMFLAREPLMDLASNVVDGVSTKRKTRKARKAAQKQDKTEAVE
ncbi:DUF3618 domain-containing protein [Sphingomonas hankyongi]|uniref:DUF3618 domain-containing protein n=1 Tax=Sphingomonas hankyongi TaxID=2908209 RepID=A0ABT0S451_9SPHN|nr:DUF3618 domain-containing protein [Sphingomonas hankyongi]MCL6730414.1 DUF3618 domain-containing protein [Sphingomonas hankyongi]